MRACREVRQMGRSIALISVSCLFACTLPGCFHSGRSNAPPQTKPGTNPRSSIRTPGGRLDEVVIGPEQFDQVTTLKVGRTFRVIPPVEATRWLVNYDAKILEALLPPRGMESPGPLGWQFKVLNVGQTDVILTSVPEANSAPPTAIRISLTIRAVK